MRAIFGTFLLVFSVLFSAANAAAVSPFRVGLLLQADKSFYSDLTSCLCRELWQLGDVTLVDEDAHSTADWVIRIVAKEVRQQNVNIIGIVASTVFYQPFDNASLKPFIVEKCEPKTAVGRAIGMDLGNGCSAITTDPRAYFLFSTEGLGKIGNHMVWTGSREDIDSFCSSIITDLNAHHLEGPRRIRKDMEERIRRRLPAMQEELRQSLKE